LYEFDCDFHCYLFFCEGYVMIVMLILNLSIDCMVSIMDFYCGEVHWVIVSWIDPGGKGVNIFCVLIVYKVCILVVFFVGGP